jgi:hypothetical protein
LTFPAPSTGKPATPRRPGDIPVGEILAWIVRWRVALAIVAGIALRLVGFVQGRQYWMDEDSLVVNIQSLTPAGFFGPLLRSQLAPPGFLVAVWSTVRLFGDNVYTMRLVPFAGGIASLFLFLAVARRTLPPRAVFNAVVMFALASDPTYYAAEIKQYSTDMASCLAILLTALTIAARPLTAARTALLASGGAAIVWFSHPSIFVLASVGVVGWVQAIASRDWRRVASWSIVGLAWLDSFAAVHAVATRQMGGSDQMWRFWNFAFPPMPPRSLWDATWTLRRLAFYFINPLNFDAPFGERLSLLPALGLAVLGVFRLGKLDRSRLALLALPVALTLVAASMRLYPFHGRLVLFLVPIFLIAIAAGLDAVREARGPGLVYYGLAAMLLLALLAGCGLAFDTRPNHNNRFGDLHPYALDPFRFPL